MNMQEFNTTFDHLTANCKHSKLLEKAIGKLVTFKGKQNSDGYIHTYGEFEIIGVQNDFKGEVCFRVKCVKFRGKAAIDNFGHTMPLSRAQFV